MNRQSRASIFESPVLTGAIVVLVMVIGIYISYGADRGLPFVPTYQLSVLVPDAQKIVPGDAVHIGGARVGQVIKETALPGNPPYAKLTLALEASQKVPVDSTVEIRPLSILGAKYVSLTLGPTRRFVPQGGTLPLAQAHTTVELNDAFQVFDPPTTQAIRSAISGLGDAFAGRGADLNAAIGSTARLLGPLEHFTRLLISPRTDLSGFIAGLDSFTTALAPVADQLASGVQNAATTFDALAAAGTQYGQAIDQLPQTETIGTQALGRITPVLGDAAAIARAIRPGARLLPSASRNLANALEAAVPPLRKAPALSDLVNKLDQAINAVTSPGAPALSNSLTELNAATQALHLTLNTLVPAQVTCNVMGIQFRNTNSTIGIGLPGPGSWLSVIPMVNTPQSLPQPAPSANLHTDPYPVENATRCDSGNEQYLAGQVIGSPAYATGTVVDQTAPPASSTALAAQAGLLTPPQGARP